MTKSKGILPPKRFWTGAELELLRALYPDHSATHVAAQLQCGLQRVYSMAQRLGLAKSESFLASAASGRLDGLRGAETRFKKGQVPWSAGMKGLDLGGRSHETRFVAGSMPHNHLPVGTELMKSNGYVYVKVAEPKTWIAKHFLEWKKAHGSFPPKGHVLVFRDGRHTNCEPTNLELITRSELQARNSIHSKSPELGRLVQLKGQITRQLNRIVREHRERSPS